MKRNYVVGLAVIVAWATTQIVSAQGGNSTQGGGPTRVGTQGMGMRASSGALALTNLPPAILLTNPNSVVKLTEDQKTAVTNLQIEYQKALSETPKEPKANESKFDAAKTLADANKALRDALTTRDPKDKDIPKLIEDVQKAEKTVIKINLEYWTKLRAILTTDDQLKQLNQMLTPRVRGANNRGTGGQGGNRQGGGNNATGQGE